MSYYGQGLDGLGSKIERGLTALARAIESAAEKQGKPITYNVIVNAGGGDEAAIAKRVADTIRNMEARRGNSGN